MVINMKKTKVTSENIRDVLKSDKPVFIDFFAPWCIPCKRMTPVIESLEKNIGDKANIYSCNIDDCEELCDEYGIMSVPTCIVFKDGMEKGRIMGLASEKSLSDLILK